MPRTSRTARATRAASAVCPTAPSLVLLPLVLGALIAGLWLLGAAPASADEGTGALLHGGPSADASADGSSSTSSSTEGTPDTGPPNTDSLVLHDSAPLGDVVPEEITEPVTSTLGTVHHRLERGARRTTAGTAAVLPEATWPVGEVSEGARRVVEELDRTGRETAGDVLTPVAAVVTDPSPAPPRDDTASDQERSETSRDDGGPNADTAIGTVRHHVPRAHAGTDAAEDAPSRADGAERHDTESAATGSPAHQLSTGSAAPSGGQAPAPAVVGYLTTAPVTAPAADAVLLAAHVLHPVPGGPSDDPTFSPD